MKRANFLKALVALPFVGKLVDGGDSYRVEETLPEKPVCPRCGGTGVIITETYEQGLIYRVEGEYFPKQVGPLYTEEGCPLCNPQGQVSLVGSFEVEEPYFLSNKGAFRYSGTDRLDGRSDQLRGSRVRP